MVSGHMAMRWAVLCLLGCHHKDEGTPVEPVDFTTAPAVTINPAAGLTAWLDLSVSEPRSIVVELHNTDRVSTITTPVAADHHVLLVGFRAGSAHEIVVRAVDDEGRTAAEQTLSYTTPPLPTDFFQWEMGTVSLSQMEIGATLVGFGNYLTLLDPEGFPVWYLPIQGSIHEANRLANGNFLVVVNRTMVHEFSLDGTLVSSYRAAGTDDVPAGSIAVDVDATHHDAIELPNGNLVGLSIERRMFDDYPSSESDPLAPPAPAWVAGDIIVEWTRDGTVVNRWPLLDLLDPTRIAYDSVVGNYWEDFEPWIGDDIKDWSHGNALSYDAATDTLLVGMRHQDAVIGLSHSTGELSFIIAPPEGWPSSLQDKLLTPTDPGFVYPYHPHGAKFTPDGTVMLFDNGNNRASAYETPTLDWDNFSRALELQLDLTARTYSTVFEFGQNLDPNHFSGSLGDADPLPNTGNVLVTFGNIGNPDLGGVRIVEVTRAGEIVWDLVVPYPTATTYRAQRLSGVIPGL